MRGGRLRLHSRNGYDVTEKFGMALTGLVDLGRDFVLDGEIVVPDERGVTHLDDISRGLREVADLWSSLATGYAS